MMWCRLVQKLILIPEDESTWPSWAARHVKACENCRQFVQQTIALRKILLREPPPENEQAVLQIMARIRGLEHAAPGDSESTWQGLEWLAPRWGFRLALAAALILIVAVHVSNRLLLSSPHGEIAVEEPVDRPVLYSAPVHNIPQRIPPLPRPVVVYVETPRLPPTPIGPVIAAASNEGAGIEFGGVPIVPVSFDY